MRHIYISDLVSAGYGVEPGGRSITLYLEKTSYSFFLENLYGVAEETFCCLFNKKKYTKGWILWQKNTKYLKCRVLESR